MINWDALTKQDTILIGKIVKRFGVFYPGQANINTDMDISAAHIGCKMDLEKMLNADDFNFLHDVCGIINNIDRSTGELKNCFLPRHSI